MLGPALLAGLLVAPSPSTPEVGVGLSWDAPASCPDRDQLRASVEAIAPGTLDAADRSGTRIDARVDESTPGEFTASIEIANVAGVSSRSFVGPDCGVVTRAVALLTAVALDPVRSAVTVREVASERAPDPEPDPEPDPPDPDPAPRSRPAAEPKLRVGLRVFGQGSYGPTNAGYAGVGGGFSLIGARWRAELVGSWATPRQLPRFVVSEVPRAGIFDGWAVAARGCYVFRPKFIELPLCPAVELGEIRGRGVPDLPVALDARMVWFAFGLGQGLWYAPIERFALGIEVNAAFPVTRGGFFIDNTQIQRVSPVSVRGLFSLELRLP